MVDDPDPGVEALRRRCAELERRVAERDHEIFRLREQLEIERLKLEQTEGALWQMAVLFLSVPIPVVLMDLRGIVTDVNAQAERALGVRRDDLLGRSFKHVIPEHRHERFDAMLARCRTGEVVRNVEHELWRRSGRFGGAGTTMFPIKGRDGAVIGAAIAEDIQELKQTGILLSNLNKELQQLATIDALTGLPNRRAYEQTLLREVGRAARTGRPLSIAMLDVDAFKEFNDRLGHAAGDDCLIRVAKALRSALRRPADFVARYGGEEFVAILPLTDAAGARLMAERLRRAVESLAVPHPASAVAPCVTASVGVATVTGRPGIEGHDLQAEADRALFTAKAEGRNRVCAVEMPGGRTSDGSTDD